LLSKGTPGELIADDLTYERSGRVLVARGHAVLRASGVTVWADQLTYDQTLQHATAKGNVMMVRGLTVAFADEIGVDLESDDATLERGFLIQKRGVTPERLLAAKSPEDLRTVGQVSLAMTGTRIKRIGEGHFLVDNLSFTPCDCNPAKPSWRIDAVHADLVEGERAILTFPVIFVRSVPVFAFPWMYLPLSERRTGLLVPRPVFSLYSGFTIDLPVFITLGDSYDVTLTPGYYTGASPNQYGNLPPIGIKGPRLQTEFRYVPSDQTRGRFSLGVIDDRREAREPFNYGPFLPLRPRGLRWEIGLQHAQELGGGFSGRVDAFAVSDGYYIRDLAADILTRVEPYIRSTGVLYRRDEDSYAGLDVTLRQDVRWGFNLLRKNYDRTGAPQLGPNTMQRLPAITYDLPQRQLWGPLFGGFRLEYSRIAPLSGLTGDEGTSGVYNPDPAYVAAAHAQGDYSQGDRRYQPGEREARDRIDFRPRISAGFAAGRFARFTPYAGYRQDIYLGEVTGKTTQRGYPILGVTADSELARVYSLGSGAVRHAITPSIELRYVPPVLGSAWPILYDEVDAAVPAQGLFQSVMQLSQSWSRRSGSATQEILRFDLAQDWDLRRRMVGDSFVRANLRWGPATTGAMARYNFRDHRLNLLSTWLNVSLWAGGSVAVSYENITIQGPERFRRGIDSLVGAPLPAPLQVLAGDPKSVLNPGNNGFRAQLIVASFRTTLPWGFGFSYVAQIVPHLVPLRDEERLADPNQLPRVAWSAAQQVASLSYNPACGCWSFEVYARRLLSLGLPGSPWVSAFGANLVISRFGSFGIGQ
jgi:LPS-assembly protein